MSYDLTNQNISDTFQNLLQKTGSGNQLYDLQGNQIIDLTIAGALHAQSYIVSQSVSNLVVTSGSTVFGDSTDDTHNFNGEISASGQIHKLMNDSLGHFPRLELNNNGKSAFGAPCIEFGSGSTSGYGNLQMVGVLRDTLPFVGSGGGPKLVFRSGSIQTEGDKDAVVIDFIEPTTKLIIDGHITASGHISASGVVHGGSFKSAGKLIGTYNGETVTLGNIDTPTTIVGNITASGNISSSGNLSVTGDLNLDGKSHFEGNITASGDISSSGDIIGGDLKLTAGSIALASDTDNKIEIDDSGHKYNAKAGHTMHYNEQQENVTIKMDSSAGNNLFSKGNAQLIGMGGNEDPKATLDITGNLQASSHITASGNISASWISTGSFGKVLGDGSGLTNVTAGFPFTGSAEITGSLNVIGEITSSQAILARGTELDFSISASANTHLIVSGANNEVMVGTENPSGKLLTVHGDISASGVIYANNIETDFITITPHDFVFGDDSSRSHAAYSDTDGGNAKVVNGLGTHLIFIDELTKTITKCVSLKINK